MLLGVVVFLAVSFELARYLNTETQERNAVFDLLRDQARGDAAAMIDRLDGCAADPRCRATATRNAARLRRAGERLAQQEASVERFLELSGDDFPETG